MPYYSLIDEKRSRLGSLEYAAKKVANMSIDEAETIIKQEINKSKAYPYHDPFYWGSYLLYGASK